MHSTVVQRTHLFNISGCVTKFNNEQLHLFCPLDFVGSQHWNVWRDARNDAVCTRKDLRWGGPAWNSDWFPALLCQSQWETDRAQREGRTCVEINKAQVLYRCCNIQRGPTYWIEFGWQRRKWCAAIFSLTVSLYTIMQRLLSTVRGPVFVLFVFLNKEYLFQHMYYFALNSLYSYTNKTRIERLWMLSA